MPRVPGMYCKGIKWTHNKKKEGKKRSQEEREVNGREGGRQCVKERERKSKMLKWQLPLSLPWAVTGEG